MEANKDDIVEVTLVLPEDLKIVSNVDVTVEKTFDEKVTMIIEHLLSFQHQRLIASNFIYVEDILRECKIFNIYPNPEGKNIRGV